MIEAIKDQFYRRIGATTRYKCVYVGSNYMVLHSELLDDSYINSVMVPKSDLAKKDEPFGWELAPKKHTGYLWLLRDAIGLSFTMASIGIESGHNYGYEVLACQKIGIEDGAFCDEWKQELAKKAEKDRSAAGDKVDTADFPRVIDAVTGRDLGSAD